MTLSDEERRHLTENYMNKSRATVGQVHFLIENNQLSLAISRIYYGIYYALSALSVKNGFETSKHGQLIGWFNRTYVKTETVDKKYSKWIRKAYENRTEGDYNVFSVFTEEEVGQSFDEMKAVISEIEHLLI